MRRDTQKQLTLFQMEETPIPIRTVAGRPPGYRGLGKILDKTPKAVQVSYYKWVLWLPRKAVRRIRGVEIYFAPSWAIESAKEHPSALQRR